MDENLNNTEAIDNLQVIPAQSKQITPKEANYVFLISAITQVLIGIVLGMVVILVAYIIPVGDETKLYYYFVSPFTELGAIFLPVLIYFLIKKVNYKKALRLNKIQLKHILPLMIIAIAAQYAGGFLNYIVIFLLGFLGKVPAQEIPIPNTILELMYTIFFIAAIPGVCEEILARGLIMRGYEGFGAKRAIIVSAFIFGLMHFDLTNFVFPMFLGLILGYAVYRTNSIFAGMIIHFTNNAYGAVMLYLLGKAGDVEQPSSLHELLMSGIPAVVGFALIAIFLYYIYKTADKQNEQEVQVEAGSRSLSKVLRHWPLIIAYVGMLVVAVVTVYKIINGID